MKTKIPGSGTTCPHCKGPKPSGSSGKGISLSRFSRKAICSMCGLRESLLPKGTKTKKPRANTDLTARLRKLADKAHLQFEKDQAALNLAESIAADRASRSAASFCSWLALEDAIAEAR